MPKTISLRKALQVKKTLAGDIAKLKSTVKTNNSVKRVNPNIDVKVLHAELNDKINKLLELKTAITIANTPIYSKIVLADELKAKIAFYEELNVQLFSTAFDAQRNVVEIDHVVSIGELERNEIVKQLKVDLEAALDAIDYYNSTTTITVEV
jgi:hypothetical protein